MHLIGSTLALLAAGTMAGPYIGAPMIDPNMVVPKGKKVQWIGHSFHFFLPNPVASLAKEAGISGHVNLGFDMIPASVPCQHWNKGGAWKTVVQNGGADVVTLATREDIPDPCIPKFVKLAHAKQPNVRVMVQETWLPFSLTIPEMGKIDPENKTQLKQWIDTPAKNIKKCAGIIGCSARNSATYETLERTRKDVEGPYRNVSVLVPVWDATLTLRQFIAKGRVPGTSKQTDLFMDNLGHAKKPLQDMVSYPLYNTNPAGMKALSSNSAQAKVFQEVAWDALKKESLNGLTGTSE